MAFLAHKLLLSVKTIFVPWVSFVTFVIKAKIIREGYN